MTEEHINIFAKMVMNDYDIRSSDARKIVEAVVKEQWLNAHELYTKEQSDYPDTPGQFDNMAIEALQQEPKTGYWIRISPAKIYECSECGQNIMTSDICAYKFCHGCGAKMVEPQESEGV